MFILIGRIVFIKVERNFHRGEIECCISNGILFVTEIDRKKAKVTKPSFFTVSGEDEEWSDSEKTPSVSSGVEGGGSAVSSPIAPVVEEESSLPPPPRLNPPSSSVAIANSAAEDIRLRLSVLSEDARKRLASLTEDIEVKLNFYVSSISLGVKMNEQCI